MILTSKAKEDFEKWLDDYSQEHHGLKGWIENDMYLDEVELPTPLLLALQIEWLDSVDIRIYLRRDGVAQDGFNWSIEGKTTGYHNICNHAYYFTRQKATEAAIKLANKIYNNEHTK